MMVGAASGEFTSATFPPEMAIVKDHDQLLP